QLIEFLGVEPARVQAVRLGSESDWTPATESERRAAREHFLVQPGRRMVAFIGGIGYDNNKGIDTLIKAWHKLCQNPEWDADLFIAGDGRALPHWRAVVKQCNLPDRV